MAGASEGCTGGASDGAVSAAPSLRLTLVTGGAAVAMFALAFVCASFDAVLREDGLAYLQQAFAIRGGDWTAEAHPMGWAALLAGALGAFGVDELREGMLLARLLSVTLTAACVVPFAGFARRAVGERAAVLAVVAFAFSPTLLRLAGIAYSDPLFLFLTLCSLRFAATATRGEPRKLLLASGFASLAYYAKPNGLFLLLALCVFALLVRRRAGRGVLFVAWLPLLFVAVSLPHLILRAETFGSPLGFGENSKYFVDSYQQVWDTDVPVPSLTDYLTSHTLADWYHKFVRSGVFKVVLYFYQEIGSLWALLLMFAGVGLARHERDSGHLLPLITLAVFLLGLVPVFHVFGDQRYMAVMLPFVFVLGARALVDLVDGRPAARWLTAVFVALLMGQVPLALSQGQLVLRTDPGRLQTPNVRDDWAVWTVRNLRAPVAILEGGDLLQVALAAARAAGDVPPAEPGHDPGFRIRRPGRFASLQEALANLRRHGIEHLLVDSHNRDRRPYLREVHDPESAALLELVRSFRSSREDRWQIRDMDVFRILPARE